MAIFFPLAVFSTSCEIRFAVKKKNTNSILAKTISTPRTGQARSGRKKSRPMSLDRHGDLPRSLLS